MGITLLSNDRILGNIILGLLTTLLSLPILHVLKMWAYDSTPKKMRKARRKRRLKKQTLGGNFPPFFLLDDQRVRAPKRYVVYYYGYLSVVISIILSAWLRAYNILTDATNWFWTSKLLLDTIIGTAYLRQTRHQK